MIIDPVFTSFQHCCGMAPRCHHNTLFLASVPTWASSLAWTGREVELGKEKYFPLVLAGLGELERAHLAPKVSKNRKLS